MPKAVLEFTLPEEQPEFDMASRAGDMRAAISEFAEYLRTEDKYGGERNAEIDAAEAYRSAREKYCEIMSAFLD